MASPVEFVDDGREYKGVLQKEQFYNIILICFHTSEELSFNDCWEPLVMCFFVHLGNYVTGKNGCAITNDSNESCKILSPLDIYS